MDPARPQRGTAGLRFRPGQEVGREEKRKARFHFILLYFLVITVCAARLTSAGLEERKGWKAKEPGSPEMPNWREAKEGGRGGSGKVKK